MATPREKTKCESVWLRLLGILAWLLAGFALIVWCTLTQTADRHWIGTLLAFGPKWTLLIPVSLVAIPAAIWRQRALVPLSFAAIVVVWPVMGLCIPWHTWRATSPIEGSRIKILTCNTQVGHTDDRLDELIRRVAPDVVLFQEWPSERLAPPSLSIGWELARDGQIFVASRLPIIAHEALKSPQTSVRTIGLRCELRTVDGSIQLFALHLLTPRNGLEAVLAKRSGGIAELEAVTERREIDSTAVAGWIDRFSGPKVVAGDLNLTPESTIYRDCFGHLQNAFSMTGWGWGGTKFTRKHSVRIDHVLADNSFEFTSCIVGPDVGSDHRPVVAEAILAKNAAKIAGGIH